MCSVVTEAFPLLFVDITKMSKAGTFIWCFTMTIPMLKRECLATQKNAENISWIKYSIYSQCQWHLTLIEHLHICGACPNTSFFMWNVLSPSCQQGMVSFSLIKILIFYWVYFRNKETEFQGGQHNCPMSQSKTGLEPTLTPSFVWSQSPDPAPHILMCVPVHMNFLGIKLKHKFYFCSSRVEFVTLHFFLQMLILLVYRP